MNQRLLSAPELKKNRCCKANSEKTHSFCHFKEDPSGRKSMSEDKFASCRSMAEYQKFSIEFHSHRSFVFFRVRSFFVFVTIITFVLRFYKEVLSDCLKKLRNHSKS